MRILYRFRWPVFVLLLLVGCRSQQAAFRFQAPGPRAVATRPTASASVGAISAAMLPRPVATASSQEAAIFPARAVSAHRAPRITLRHHYRAVRPAAAVTAIRSRQPRDEGAGNPWLLALGIVLVVGAVAAGLLVGGGAGLLVGIAGSLVGYYFLAKGILGPHAWLEIGQELFQL